MNSFFYAVDAKDNVLINTFPIHLNGTLKKILINSNEKLKITIDGNHIDATFGYRRSNYGTLYILTTVEKYVRKLKLFNKFIGTNLILLEVIPMIRKDILQKHNSQTEELIHNLTSLNTYNIQDIHSLIPESLLSKNINEQQKTVKHIIHEKPNVTADTLLRIIKNNLSMKIEFSVFEKTHQQYPSVQKMEHDVRSLIVSILKIFMQEFDDKKIVLSLAASEKSIYIDYESFAVSLYFILENAVKYCLRGSYLFIRFQEEQKCFSIIFDMMSLRIEDDEIEQICTFGYRAPNAASVNKKGKGIGMYRVLKTLKLNDAHLEIIPRVSNKTKNIRDIVYENNIIKIKISNQQNLMEI